MHDTVTIGYLERAMVAVPNREQAFGVDLMGVQAIRRLMRLTAPEVDPA